MSEPRESERLNAEKERALEEGRHDDAVELRAREREALAREQLGAQALGSPNVFQTRTHVAGCGAAMLGVECACPPPRDYVAVDALLAASADPDVFEWTRMENNDGSMRSERDRMDTARELLLAAVISVAPQGEAND